MALKIFTAPAEHPVTLEEARLHLRVTQTALNALIQGLIIGAAAWAEDYTGRAFITQTWELYLDAFPECEILVPNPPLASVTHIKYLDNNGAEQTVASANYIVDLKSEPARVVPAYGFSWPSTYSQINAVTVRFMCGYGLHAAVPERVRIAQLLHIEAHHNRDERQMGALLSAAENLLFPYRILRR